MHEARGIPAHIDVQEGQPIFLAITGLLDGGKNNCVCFPGPICVDIEIVPLLFKARISRIWKVL